MSRDGLEGHFLPGREGPIFVLRRGPARARAAVIVVPPFAEEMNKCRRMLALVATGLAEQGIATVVPDFFGTGDSGGDFVHGSIGLWRDDLIRVLRWCDEVVAPVRAMLAVRLGAAIVCDPAVLAGMPNLQGSVLWQPVLDGPRFATQFLRLRVAASMASGSTETVANLRREALESGEIEVAGYCISSQLLTELDRLRAPDRLPSALGDIEWHEVVRDLEAGLAPPSKKIVDATIAGGASVAVQTFTSEPFWSATEVVTNLQMVQASVATLSRVCGGTEVAA